MYNILKLAKIHKFKECVKTMANTLSVKKQNRWVPVIASIFLQMVCGTAYIWSIFQTPVASQLFVHYGKNANQAAALSFSILLAVLTFGSTIGGRLSDKYSPRPVLIGGGIIIFIGFFLASFYTPNYAWLIYLTYGVLGGFGMGALYSTTIATCQKWFPDKRGFISGVIVSALGLGSAVFTIIAAKGFTPWTPAPKSTAGLSEFEKIVKMGMVPAVGPFKTFLYLSFIFLIMCLAAAFFIKTPPQGYMPEGWTPPAPKGGLIHQNFTTKEMIKTSQFYMVVSTFLLASVSGLIVINFAKQIAIDKGIKPDDAFWGVVIISICNAIGRLFWGTISDKLGRKNTILLLLACTAVLIISIGLVGSNLIILIIGLLGFIYGGFLGNFPALTADFFGSKSAGMNYGVVLLGFGVGAVLASNVGGYFKDVAVAAKDPSKMFPAFVIGAVCAVIGLVIMFFLKPPKEKAEK